MKNLFLPAACILIHHMLTFNNDYISLKFSKQKTQNWVNKKKKKKKDEFRGHGNLFKAHS